MSKNDDNLTPEMDRRSVLGGIAGLGALSLSSGYGSAEEQTSLAGPTASGPDSHHPGQPRFVAVGEKLSNPIHVGPGFISDRDNLAPRIPDFGADPENYSADDFEWSVASSPSESSGDVLTFESNHDEDRPRWTDDKQNVAEFEADAAGTYVLKLTAPDGVHEQTIHAFEPVPQVAGGPPRVSLEAEYDSGASEFVIHSNAKLAPNSNASLEDLRVEFLADDRDALSHDDITVEDDGQTARVPVSAVGEASRVHAAPYDGDVHGMTDTVMLDGEGGVELPNRPPDWMKNGVMYEIFTRSWAGERGETTMQTFVENVDYLDELGIDAVWLTPVVPSESSRKELAGGGPHGYDANDYMAIAPDLGTVDDYKAFVDACNKRDIKVVFDLVINHGGRHHDFFRDTIAQEGPDSATPEGWEYPPVEELNEDSKYFDWFDRMDMPISGPDGGQVEPAPANTGFWGLRVMPNWNFDNMALREHMLAVADFWSGQVGVDGFRCDIAWGVPHSMWKDIREICRENNSEFLLLDESIPKDPSFTENEFDMHFDTATFMNTIRGIGRDGAPAGELLNAVTARKEEGFPDHTLILNSTENHDEHRLLSQIIEGNRENPRKAQRACFAACATLPGVPFVYYGQERAISEFGESRYMGEDDPRDGDVGPGNVRRAFMNWDEYPEDHLEFYKETIAAYQDLDVLKPDAAMSTEWYSSPPGEEPNVLVFGRDASDLEDVNGPEKAVVIINFEDDPSEVFLRPEISSVDQISGEDVHTGDDFAALPVEVDTVAVLETPSLLPEGDVIYEKEDANGDDVGPGGYTYPNADAYGDGAFDVIDFAVQETEENYQFNYRISGDLENPWGLDNGFSHQYLQVYLRNLEADGGSTSARTGVNAEFTDPYQYRVVADGENGARLEDADGNKLAAGDIRLNKVEDRIIAEIPKTELPGDVSDMSIAPLMLGYDGMQDGGVRPVESSAGDHVFGGAENDSAPNVIDAVVPDGATQKEELAYSKGELAQISYIPIATEFSELTVFEDEVGDGMASGQYTLPTNDAYYENAWDFESVSVDTARSRVRFNYTMAEDIQNPWGFDIGFCHQMFQIYINAPGGDAEGGTEGRAGTSITTAQPYHYRIAVHGEGTTSVENAAGDNVTTDVNVVTKGNTVSIDVPKSAIGWSDEEGIGIQPITVPYDGFGEGGVRAIAPDNGDHMVGGGTGDNDPAAMDILTPEGEDQSAILTDYSADSKVALPFVAVNGWSADGMGGGSGGEEGGEEGGESGGEEGGESGGDDGEGDGLPGFGAAVGAAGVAGGAAAAARRANKDDEDEDLEE